MTGQNGWESLNPLTTPNSYLFHSALSLLPPPSRAELVPSPPPPIDLLTPAAVHRFLPRAPFSSCPPPPPHHPKPRSSFPRPESALHRRPPWERRPSSTPSRRSASSVLLRPNRPQGWVLGELLHLPRFFPALFPEASSPERRHTPHACRRFTQVRIIRPSTGSSDSTLFLGTKLTPENTQVQIIRPRVGSSGTFQWQKVLFGRIMRPMGRSSDQGDLTVIRSQNFLVVVGLSGVGSDHPISTDL